ncbi:hypothetical protein E1295_12920 [Nonomuraea mesophila]|uniref:Novel STAND NTPase 1 domain-containing protein n=1 Tax=Nonomuraea mesophila TaxID=2530382 RepID=A0A4R5FSF2_9ACTN|nr:tetratricopeptide repeat protein [Nonomuraea mesophila]TDE55839.1 hypothetical protein E1295_12920 [Nonomuraea mesophila]
MSVFRAADHHVFFGRDRESREVCKLWQTQRLTILYGASGIGKSSLIQAGVLPLLSPSMTDVLPLGQVSYGSTFPRAALAPHNPYVLALLASWSPAARPTRLAGMTIPAFLRTRPVKHDAYGEPTVTLMAVDQVEELFVPGRRNGQHRDWFFCQLAEALQANSRLRVLLSIRADRLRDLLEHERELLGAVPNADDHPLERFSLEALDSDSALEAVRGPVRGTGRAFAPGAAEQLVAELLNAAPRADPPGRSREVHPVQLQVVCEALWNALPPEQEQIAMSDVLGYADRALSGHYDREIGRIAWQRYDGDDRRLRTWLRMTFSDRTESRTRSRRAVRQGTVETAGVGRSVLALLVKRHILLAGRRGGEEVYELAHHHLLKAPGRDEQQSPPPASPGCDDLLGEAASAHREGDLLLAARLGEEALSRSGDDLSVRAQIESLLGNVAYERGDLDEAISRYSTAAKGFETAGAVASVGPLLTAIGRLRLAQGSPAKAVRELQAAMIRVPADLTIQTELAWALWHGGHPDAAVGMLNGVLDREGNNTDALLRRGQILAGMERPRAALRDLDRAKPLRWPFAKVAHALALAQVDSMREAQREMVEALAESVDHGPLLWYAARVEQLAGKTASAVDLAKRAISARTPALPHHMAEPARRLVAAQ